MSVAPPARAGVVDFQEDPGGNRRADGKLRPGGFWEYKVLIAVSPSYTGPFTVEGKQIDGPNPVDWLIENEQVVRILGLPGGFGWHYYATSALLGSSGCYALRIDGTSFSSLVYFKVVSDATYRKLTGRSRA